MRQSACLVINAVTVDNFPALFKCTPMNRMSDSMMARPYLDFHFSWLGPKIFLVFLCSTVDLPLLQINSDVVGQSRDLKPVTQHIVSVESSSLLLHSIKS